MIAKNYNDLLKIFKSLEEKMRNSNSKYVLLAKEGEIIDDSNNLEVIFICQSLYLKIFKDFNSIGPLFIQEYKKGNLYKISLYNHPVFHLKMEKCKNLVTVGSTFYYKN